MISWFLCTIVIVASILCKLQSSSINLLRRNSIRTSLRSSMRLKRHVAREILCNVSKTSGAVILNDDREQIMIGLLLPFTLSAHGSEYGEGGAKFYAEAFNIAVERINNNVSLLPGYRIDYIFNNTRCNEIDSIRAMHYQYMFQKNRGSTIHAFVGLGCHCNAPVKFAGAINVPVVSHMCSSQELSDKKAFPTFASTYPLLNLVTPTIKGLLRALNWKNVALIYSKDSVKYREASDDIIRGLGDLISWKHGLKSTQYNPADEIFLEIFKEVKSKARIIILFMEYTVAREGLLCASRMGLGSGEYEFIVVEQDWLSLERKLELPFKWSVSSFPTTNKVIHEEKVKRMFPYTLILGVKHENNGYRKEYKKHTDMLKDRIRGPPFCSQYYSGVYRKLNVPLENIYLYDAAHVLALAMNRTLQRGKKVDDGLEVVASMENISYRSIDGSIRKMSSDLSSKESFSLFTYGHDNKGTKTFIEVGHFNEHSVLVRKKSLSRLPQDTPTCGFNGELCRSEEKTGPSCRVLKDLAVSLSAILLMLAFLFLCVFIYRKRTSSLRIGWVAWNRDGKYPPSLIGL